MAKGSETRERVLRIAEQSVLEKGFGATSIEEIIAAAEITKSGFFYHFKDKNELARVMLLRYLENEEVLLRGCLETRFWGGWPGLDVIPNGYRSQFGEPHVDTDHPSAA